MVEICEVGPRDGLQNLARVFTVEERARLISRLAAAGLRRIEAVSFVNPMRVPAMGEAEAVLAQLRIPDDCRLSGLVMNEKGVARALDTRLDELRYVVVTSETLSQRNQGCATWESAAAFGRIEPTVRASGRALTGVVAAAFGCPFEGEVDPARVADIVASLIDAGADEIIIADTIGVAVPGEVRRLAELCRPALKNRPLGFHFHNTRNTGFANAVAAIEAGAATLDASIGGLGGCPFAPGASGNIATEDLVYLLSREGAGDTPDLAALIGVVDWLARLVPADVSGMMRKAGPFPTPRKTSVERALVIPVGANT